MIDNYMHFLAYQMNQQPTPRYQRNIRRDDTLGREGSLSPDPYLQPRRLTHAASLLLRSRLLKPPKIPEHRRRSGQAPTSGLMVLTKDKNFPWFTILTTPENDSVILRRNYNYPKLQPFTVNITCARQDHI